MLSCGECQRCTSSGVCEPVTDAEHESCSGEKACNSAGRCVAKGGQRCTANEQCQSGVCEDQVCCTSPCSAICSRCDAESSGGSCAAYDGNDSSCPAPNTCTRGDCARVDAQSLVREFALVFGRGTSSRRRGQIITIARAGELLEVRISARCTAANDRLFFTIETVGEDGNPSGTEFATVYNPTHPVVPPHGDVLGFRLLGPRAVSAGERLALLVTTSTDGSVCHIFGSDSDVYPQGYAYDEATGVPVQRLHDHWFQVLMR